MRDAVLARFADADAVVMAAAVADFRPKAVADQKLKKDAGVPELLPRADARTSSPSSGSAAAEQVLVGFAAETDDLERAGREKLASKHLDLSVVNRVGREGTGFGADTNDAMLLAADGERRAAAQLDQAGARGRRAATGSRRCSRGSDGRRSRPLDSRAHERVLPLLVRVRHRGPSRQARRPDLRRRSSTRCSREDPDCRVACETLVTTGLVMVSGEITTDGWVDIPSVVRATITDVGYTDAKFGLDGETCGVVTAIQEQSPDIARGVEDCLRASARATPATSSTCSARGTRG